MIEEQLGWKLQAVISRASFRRFPRNDNYFIIMNTLHINKHYVKKRGITKKFMLTVCTEMIQAYVDMTAEDFNDVTWRRPSDSDRPSISIIEEVFVNTNLSISSDVTPLWGPGNVTEEWDDVYDFLKSSCTEPEWQVRIHGAFVI